jgi:hydrogenase-4 component F
MLAYHSVEHMGVIVLAAGIGGTIGSYAAVLHLIAHSLTKASLFFSGGAIAQAYGTRRLHRLRGLIRTTPAAGTVLLLGVFGLAGFPPFAMFVSEFSLVSGAVGEGRATPGIVGLVFIALAASALLYHAIDTAFGAHRGREEPHVIPRMATVSALLPLVVATWVGLIPPGPIRDLLRDAARIVEG